MSNRDANIAYLKRLKTRYELRAKELELQEIASRYRLDVFKPVPPPLSCGHPHYHKYNSRKSLKSKQGFDGDNCPCNADMGYNELYSSRNKEMSSPAEKTTLSDSIPDTDESSTSLDSLDLATLSSIRQLVKWEKDTKRRIARLDKAEEVIVAFLTGKQPPHKNNKQVTVDREPIPNFDVDIQSDVERMQVVVDHLALKVKEPTRVEKEDVAPSKAVPLSCQPKCPFVELSSNLQDAAKCVGETMPAITSSLARIEKIVSKQETVSEASEEEVLVVAIGCGEDVAEPIVCVDDDAVLIVCVDDGDEPIDCVDDDAVLIVCVDEVDEPIDCVEDVAVPINCVEDVAVPIDCVDDEAVLIVCIDDVDEPIDCVEDVAVPIDQDERDKANSKMETMRRNIDLVVDHLKVCEECPVEEFTNINHDLENILEIFHSIHDAESLNAGNTPDAVTEETWEGAEAEQDGSAMDIIDKIVAKASQIVCETIVRETEVYMQQIKQSDDDESTLLKVNKLGKNLDGDSTKLTESHDKMLQEPDAPEVTAAPPETNCGCLTKDNEPTQRMLLEDSGVESASKEEENFETEKNNCAILAPMAGESVSCQTAITFSGRSRVNVSEIRVLSVALCATVAKDEDRFDTICSCESTEKEEAKVLYKGDEGSIEQMPFEEETIVTSEAAETPAEAPFVEPLINFLLNEPAAVASLDHSTEEVPLASAALSAEAVLPLAISATEITAQKPSAESIPLEALTELAPFEPLPEPGLKEHLSDPASIEPVPKELGKEITDFEPSRKPSPVKLMTEETTLMGSAAEPAPIELLTAPNAVDFLAESAPEEPLVLPTLIEAFAEPLTSPVTAPSAAEEFIEQVLSNNLPSATVTEPVNGSSSKSMIKSPDTKQSPEKIASPLKLADPVRNPTKSASTPIAVKTSREKSPLKAVSSPIAGKTNREKSPIKGVSSPIMANKPREKIPVKSVSSPIAAKTNREKSPVKSTTSPSTIKPIAVNVPGKSGSTSSAAKPANRTQNPEKISPRVSTVKPVGPKASAAKRPSTPSTYKVFKPSISSVGSRSTTRSTSSKKSDAQNRGSKGDAPLERASGSPHSRCSCNRRKESPCNKQGANKNVAAGMCPSSPQRKCLCKQPLGTRESPAKGRVPNDYASPEVLNLQPLKRCFCRQWKKYRESLSKGRVSKDEKDQDKPPVAKRKKCKCKQKKQK